MRCVGLAWIVCVLSGCGGAQGFACDDDSQCFLGGEPGVCIAGSCAYPDASCASGYRYPIGAGSMAGVCAVGEGLGDTDTDAESSASTTASLTSMSSVGSETSSTTQDVATSDVASSSSTSGDTDPAATSNPTTDASTTTGGPPQSCADQTCANCAICVTEPGGDCDQQAEACWATPGCAEGSVCMIACSVEDDCTQDCCIGLSQEAVAVLIELHACSAEACAPACTLFDDLQCN